MWKHNDSAPTEEALNIIGRRGYVESRSVRRLKFGTLAVILSIYLVNKIGLADKLRN